MCYCDCCDMSTVINDKSHRFFLRILISFLRLKYTLTKGEKAKDQQKQFIDDRGIINLNKLLAVEDANRFKRIGRFDEYGGWNVEKNSHKLKKEIPNISFSSFKNMFSRKTD